MSDIIAAVVIVLIIGGLGYALAIAGDTNTTDEDTQDSKPLANPSSLEEHLDALDMMLAQLRLDL
jgi:hypothetical protein